MTDASVSYPGVLLVAESIEGNEPQNLVTYVQEKDYLSALRCDDASDARKMSKIEFPSFGLTFHFVSEGDRADGDEDEDDEDDDDKDATHNQVAEYLLRSINHPIGCMLDDSLADVLNGNIIVTTSTPERRTAIFDHCRQIVTKRLKELESIDKGEPIGEIGGWLEMLPPV